MKAKLSVTPTLLFGSVYLFSIPVAFFAGFDSVSIDTHLLVLALLFIGLCCDSAAILVTTSRQHALPFISASSLKYIYFFTGVLVVGAIFIFRLRLEQLNDFLSLQQLRMSLITGDLEKLKFPLSNVQSLSHALGIVLLAVLVHGRRSPISTKFLYTTIVLLLTSTVIALFDGNRASFIIILSQILLVLLLSGSLPKARVVLSSLLATLLLFVFLQMFMRQNDSLDEFYLVFELALRNVASYISGGMVAFDKVYSGTAIAPDFVLPVTGLLSTFFGFTSNDGDSVLPFLDLGGGIYGNVYSALYYFGFFYSTLIGLFVFSVISFITSVSFIRARSNLFALLVASYLGVTFVLWPLSEYVISLFPLFIRECTFFFLLKLFFFKRKRAENCCGRNPGGSLISAS